MPTERFLAQVALAEPGGRGAVNTTLKPLKLVILKARRTAEGKALPFTPASETTPPSAPNVWLSLWEVDSFETRRHASSSAPPSDTNDFLVELPGYVKETAPGAFEFRILAAPVLGSGENLGHFSLRLKDPAGQPWQREGRDLVVPILGEGEDEVDLGCVLEDAAGKRDAANGAWKKSGCFHAQNLTHTAGSMLADEHGLTVGFWANLNSAAQKAYRDEWVRDPANRPVTHEKIQDGGECEGKSLSDIINDDEFRIASDEWTRKYHPVGMTSSGELVLGCTALTSKGQIASTIQQVRAKLHAQLLHGRGDVPKIRRLALFTHGWPTGIKTGPHEALSLAALPAFLDGLKDHLTNDVLVCLYACLTGKAERQDVAFGRLPGAGRKLGEGSFADAFCRGLIERGLTGAAVWSHTTAGHTTRNPNLRAFAQAGAVDLVWLVKAPPGEERMRAAQADQFIAKMGSKPAETVQVTVGHPGSEVERCASRSCRVT